MKKNKISLFKIIFIVVAIYIGYLFISSLVSGFINTLANRGNDEVYSDSVFSLITTPENKVLEDTLKKFAKKNHFDLKIIYADNLEIVEKINSGSKYDAIWASNSIWLDSLNGVSTSDSKSTSITPITFGIKKSKAEKLGLIGKSVRMKDILKLIENKELTFSMANPITTNSGASSYLNILSTLAGNPDVLTKKDLNSAKLTNDLKTFFTGLARTSGDEDFLETSFINGNYDAAFTYESSIININKELEKQGKEILYAIYPVDGVSVSDSPLLYINNHNEKKKEIFTKIQNYILSGEGQEILLNLGRRTWYGGTTDKAPSNVFKKEWGIDTTKYISPIKYPSMEVIEEALYLYQTALRKPVHVVFCLDYSGSMYGDGIADLRKAMDYIFSDKAKTNMIQFGEMDKVDVIAFDSDVNEPWSSTGNDLTTLLEQINTYEVGGSTALYPAALKAVNILAKESDEYNTSIVLMTDGAGNVGSFKELEKGYKSLGKEIPIYSITFGDALEYQLEQMAKLSNGKVFDGRSDLVSAFKMVRGYN
ncbi:MAG: extracellular solute-binding protein [Bacilli bacterium]|nr:extracellular solute-binding protein [Bacilli bacterium]